MMNAMQMPMPMNANMPMMPMMGMPMMMATMTCEMMDDGILGQPGGRINGRL
ncbi:hypothetical protein AB7M32_004223 [Pseudomonas sp. R151218B TE3479]